MRSALPLVPRRSRPGSRPASTRPRCRWPSCSGRPAERPTTPRPRPTPRRTRCAPSGGHAAQRGQAELALELAQDQQDRLTLRSPLAGTVQLGRTGGRGTSVPQIQGLPEEADRPSRGSAAAGPRPPRPGRRCGSGPRSPPGRPWPPCSTSATCWRSGRGRRDRHRAGQAGPEGPGRAGRLPGGPVRGQGAPGRGRPDLGQSAAGGVTYQVDLALGEAEPGSASGRAGAPGRDDRHRGHRIGGPPRLSVPGSALVGRSGSRPCSWSRTTSTPAARAGRRRRRGAGGGRLRPARGRAGGVRRRAPARRPGLAGRLTVAQPARDPGPRRG